ncbi:MAG: hypothetical protein P8N94_06775, partial [Gammaproteobacteria bacterium]|nr:hypothetical protein [Gammaproteobacteria bacterium]
MKPILSGAKTNYLLLFSAIESEKFVKHQLSALPRHSDSLFEEHFNAQSLNQPPNCYSPMRIHWLFS